MSMSGYQRLKMAANSPSSVFTRVCSNKCGRCLTGVDSRSKGAPEFVAIDEQPNDEIVHALRLGPNIEKLL